MTGVETDLAAWLGQCIDEDGRVAQAATDGPWDFDGDSVDVVPTVRGPYVARFRDDFADDPPEPIAKSDGEHIARWDPARVLVECDTKRQVIELHQPKTVTATEDGREVSESRCVKCADRYPCQTLRLQTLPFVERDGYREEWKP